MRALRNKSIQTISNLKDVLLRTQSLNKAIESENEYKISNINLMVHILYNEQGLAS